MNTEKHPRPVQQLRKTMGSGHSTFTLTAESAKRANTKRKQRPKMPASRRYWAGAQTAKNTNLQALSQS